MAKMATLHLMCTKSINAQRRLEDDVDLKMEMTSMRLKTTLQHHNQNCKILVGMLFETMILKHLKWINTFIGQEGNLGCVSPLKANQSY